MSSTNVIGDQPGDLELGEVALWLLHVPDLGEGRLAELAATLDSAERERNDSLTLEQLRCRDVAARGTLRRLLGDYLGMPAAAVPLVRTEHGRPVLAGDEALNLSSNLSFSLSFNYSHSGDYVVYAFCRGATVGVDIEATTRSPNALGISRSYFAASEYQLLAELEPVSRDQAFFRLWTLKEAYLKARGEGIFAGLDKVVFDPRETAEGEVRMCGEAEPGSESWTFYSLRPVPDYRVALALAAPQKNDRFSLRSVCHC